MKTAVQNHFKSSDPYDRYIHLIVFSALVSCLTFINDYKPLAAKAVVTEVERTPALPELYEDLRSGTAGKYSELGVQIRQTRFGLEVHLNVGRIFYPGDDSYVTSQAKMFREFIKELNLAQHPVFVEVEGHTDPSKLTTSAWKFGTNWGLSAARATKVVHELLAQGFPEERLKVSGRGPAMAMEVSRKIASERDPASLILDRRIVLYISKDGFLNRETSP